MNCWQNTEFLNVKAGGTYGKWGYAVVQLVEALRYKSEGCEFNSRWCHWNFLLT